MIRPMAWLILLLAGGCEIAWAVGLKTYGFTFRTAGGVMTIVLMLLSFVLLDRAMRTLPLGTAYSVWVGIGAVGSVLYGMWRFGEPRDLPRIICLTLVVIGIIGLKALAPAQDNLPAPAAREPASSPS
jgi:quaternary ammonium compound-resistance protein SugE